MGITGNYRSPQADRLFLEPDGSLRQVIGTMRGLSQRKPLDPYRPVPAVTMADQAELRIAGGAGETRARTAPGSWLRVAGVDFGDGAASVTLRVSASSGGTVRITQDSPEGPVAAELLIPEGTSSPADFTVPLSLSGQTDLCFVFDAQVDFYIWQASPLK